MIKHARHLLLALLRTLRPTAACSNVYQTVTVLYREITREITSVGGVSHSRRKRPIVKLDSVQNGLRRGVQSDSFYLSVSEVVDYFNSFFYHEVLSTLMRLGV